MNDDLKKLHDRLQRATSPECAPGSGEDPETALLREGWLALGQLLEAAHPAPAAPIELPQLAKRKPNVRWRLAVVAAVAAALVVGVTLAWKFDSDGLFGRAFRPNALVAVDVERVEPSAAGPSQVSPIPALGQFEWDDPLDDEIALAAREVVRIQQDWSPLDDPFGPIYRGLEEIEEDLDQSSL